MSVEGIYREAGLSDQEVSQMPQYLNDQLEFYGSSAFEKLFEYFAFGYGPVVMPYGTAKARTGCPDEWILDYLENR